MTKPPAAVEVVLEAVMALLTGRSMTFQDTKRLLGGGEAFLVMLREFKLEDVTDSRLRLVEPYVDNPVFRPEYVLDVSFAASKFCAWVLGVVQAARWQRGYGHKKTDFYTTRAGSADSMGSVDLGSIAEYPTTPNGSSVRLGGTLDEPSLGSMTELGMGGSIGSLEDTTDLTFVQKLERKKAKVRGAKGGKKGGDTPGSISRSKDKLGKMRSMSPPQAGKVLAASVSTGSLDLQSKASTKNKSIPMSPIVDLPKSKVPGHSTYKGSSSAAGGEEFNNSKMGGTGKKMTSREQTAMAASQKKAADRLSSHNKTEGNLGAVGAAKEFRCADGITKMPYIVLGNLSLEVKCCNFIVVHDFFDTADATAIIFKQLVQRHGNLQVICFNYPGQANTVWPRLPAAERERGAREPILNNDWIADRLHELLQHAEEDGDILLTNPFHLVGIGNGSSIAASFCQKWGSDPRYVMSED